MYILVVSNYKTKLVRLLAAILIWVIAIQITSFFLGNKCSLNVTINNCLTFSHPFSYKVSSVYGRYSLSNSVSTNHPFTQPLHSSFSDYKTLSNNLKFDYPSIFTIVPQEMTGNEILYHVDFYNRQKTVHGFVQVWNLKEDIKDFLDKSMATSGQNFSHFEDNIEKINDVAWHIWHYTIKSKDGTSYTARESFTKIGDSMYRLSMFAPKHKWDKSLDKIYYNMLSSFNPYQENPQNIQ